MHYLNLVRIKVMNIIEIEALMGMLIFIDYFLNHLCKFHNQKKVIDLNNLQLFLNGIMDPYFII